MSRCYYYDPDNDWCEKYKKKVSNNNREKYCWDGGGCDKCYLTTAMCQVLGKNDDCFELESMRKLRDDFMAKDSKHLHCIQEYYDSAPAIVERLETSNKKNEIAITMQNSYILPISELFKHGKGDEAVQKYIDMVTYVKSQLN